MKIKTGYFLLYISPLFFVVLTLLLTFSVNSTIITALASSILHECGHLAVLLKYKCKIKSVTLSFYGMKIIRENEFSLGYKKEIAVCLSGVTVNFLLCAVSLVISRFYESTVILIVFAVNLILGLFNLLPVGNLDGGRALHYYLDNRLNPFKSETVLKAVSFCIIIPLLTIGFCFLRFYGNFTLLVCCIYLIVSSFFVP